LKLDTFVNFVLCHFKQRPVLKIITPLNPLCAKNTKLCRVSYAV